jgi:hypothetical protein
MLTLFVLAEAGCSKHASQMVEPATPSSADASATTGAPDPSGSLVQLHFVGPVVTLAPDLQPILDQNADFYVNSDGGVPAQLDTVPAHSVLRNVRWRLAGSGSSSGGPAKYFVVDSGFPGGATDNNSKEFPPGGNFIRLEVPKRAGGGNITVLVFVDFQPTAWWAGPDPALFPRSSDGDGRAVDVIDWAHFTTSPTWPPDGRGYFGPDSFRVVPSRRHAVHDNFNQRTFYELYGDRIYARAEGDTVHQDAWVAFTTGGFDRDSRYAPTVDATDPGAAPISTPCCCPTTSSVRRRRPRATCS